MAGQLGEMRSLFNKSVALRSPQVKGTVLTSDMLTTKKPGIGIPADKTEKVIGLKLLKDVSNDRVLFWDDLEVTDE